MNLAFDAINKTAGLSFFKLLGTGSGEGFSLYPDFSTYAILCVWEKESYAKAFIENNKGATEIVFKGINELLK